MRGCGNRRADALPQQGGLPGGRGRIRRALHRLFCAPLAPHRAAGKLPAGERRLPRRPRGGHGAADGAPHPRLRRDDRQRAAAPHLSARVPQRRALRRAGRDGRRPEALRRLRRRTDGALSHRQKRMAERQRRADERHSRPRLRQAVGRGLPDRHALRPGLFHQSAVLLSGQRRDGRTPLRAGGRLRRARARRRAARPLLRRRNHRPVCGWRRRAPVRHGDCPRGGGKRPRKRASQRPDRGRHALFPRRRGRRRRSLPPSLRACGRRARRSAAQGADARRDCGFAGLRRKAHCVHLLQSCDAGQRPRPAGSRPLPRRPLPRVRPLPPHGACGKCRAFVPQITR